MNSNKNWFSRSILFFLLLMTLTAVSQNLPSNFTRQQVVSGLNSPTSMAFLPDQRILVCQQGGQLRVVKNGSLLAAPAISLSVSIDGERGLVGVAVDPNFATNSRVYLFYITSGASPQSRVSRFTMSGDVLVPSSEQIILTIADGHMYHNGGAIVFGKDGNMFVAVGDDKDNSNPQNLDSYEGKILRINTDGGVPAGNPFSGGAARSRVWAYGLRNPFTMNVDPVSGKLFLNEVGESTWEEINNATIGGINFGWPGSEGTCSGACNPLYKYATNRAGTPPDGQGCAIAGGTFLNGSISNYPPLYHGKYFFLDYCGGWINYIDQNTGARSSFATGLGNGTVYMAQGLDGNLYYLSRGSQLYRIVYTGNTCPVISTQPANVTINVGQSATFNVSASGTGLSYQWRKNSVNISGATAASYTISNTQVSDAARYSVIVKKIGCTDVISNEATLTVNDNNQAPVAVISTPANNSFFNFNSNVNFTGTATDPEDGTLPASAYDWNVTFHHANHTHPGPGVTDGATSGSFFAATEGHDVADIWYRITLTVTDSKGKQGSASVDVFPALPSPWQRQDVGAVAKSGASGYSNGSFALLGSGADIWGTNDEFQYVYQQITGDVEIIADVERIENTNAWAKAGLMIRESLNANAKNTFAFVSPTNGLGFQRRTAAGGTTVTSGTTGEAPIFLKLKRTGDVFTASSSINGTTWVVIGTATVSMNASVYVGMALTSHNDGVLSSSVFRDVVVNTGSTNVAPAVSITAPTNNSSFNAPATVNISASATDADGTISSVQFYNGSTLLGTDNSSPYTFSWINVPAGAYALTARATDNAGAVTTSSIINITVNSVPVCESVRASADDGNIAANVLDNNFATRWSANGDGQWIAFCLGSVQNVSGVQIAFYNGNARQGIFDVQVSANGTVWTTVASNLRSSGTSTQLETFSIPTQSTQHIRILGHGNSVNTWNSFTEVKITTGSTTNTPPTTAITAPSNNATFTAPASITINANASDSDGSISSVAFYNGTTLLGTDNSSPYSFAWTNVAVGTYALTTRATDNAGAVTTSSTVNVVVSTNTAPVVSITAPANNSSFNAPATVNISANASDANGTVSSVQFYNGSTLLGTDNSSPYSVAWTNVAAGNYTLTARATDNAGAITTSASVAIVVIQATNTCSGISQYVENGGYAEGSVVQNAGVKYQCKPYPYSGWCNGSAWAYAPGTGSYWQDAWTQTGTCSGNRTASTDLEIEMMSGIFPNPASGELTIQLNKKETVAQYFILNTVGDPVLNGEVNATSVIDISSLKQGVYLIRITMDGNSEVHSFVKQ